jgi:nucleotide-binding universal stress UspA family protein
MYRCIVVGLDGSPASEAALRAACELADPAGGQIVLVHAVDALEVGRLGPWARYAYGRHVQAVARDTRAEVAAAQAYLASCASSAPCGVRARIIVRVGDASHVITAVARESGADLIVMGTHGRSGIARMAVGSVADEVVAQAPAPVLLIGPSVHAAAPAGVGAAE